MTTARVWLIGGTSESSQLAQALSAQNVPYVVTITTAKAQTLYSPTTQVVVGKLTLKAMPGFIRERQIGCILDASHPFACDISRQAMLVAASLKKAYLRYERPTLQAAQNQALAAQNHSSVMVVESIEAILASEMLRNQRVFFALGYRNLLRFSHLHPTAKLFARILPSATALAGATAAGFTAEQIIALRPPISLALEKALWQQWNISVVVAKASGQPSGEAIKRQAAAALGIQLVLLGRPPMSYPNCTSSIGEAIKFCVETLSLY